MIENIPAGLYSLCWCPGIYECKDPRDFNVTFGHVIVRCPWNYAELEGGRCVRCRLLFETPNDSSECRIDAVSFAIALCWLFLGTLLFTVLFSSLRCRLRPWCLAGTRRCVADISQMGGKLIVTTCGYHNLMTFPLRFLSVIPVTFSETGHPMLDGVQFVLRICNSRSLEVLDSSSEPIAFRADSSMGFIEVPLLRSLLHSTLHNFKLPLALQLLVLITGSMSCFALLDPPAGQGSVVVLSGGLLALLILLLKKRFRTIFINILYILCIKYIIYYIRHILHIIYNVLYNYSHIFKQNAELDASVLLSLSIIFSFVSPCFTGQAARSSTAWSCIQRSSQSLGSTFIMHLSHFSHFSKHLKVPRREETRGLQPKDLRGDWRCRKSWT